MVALITDTGEQVEGTRYSAYGVPFGSYAGDVNNDGDVDTTDTAQIQTWINGPTYDVRGDLDLDGDVDPTDKTTATNNIGNNLGWKNLGEINVDNRRGYAGYEHDLVIQRKYSAYHVRNRVLNSTFGQWMQRDPLRFVKRVECVFVWDGNPQTAVAPDGLLASRIKDEDPADDRQPWRQSDADLWKIRSMVSIARTIQVMPRSARPQRFPSTRGKPSLYLQDHLRLNGPVSRRARPSIDQ